MACRRSTTPPPRSGRSGWSRSSCRSTGGSLTSACAAVGSRLGLPKDTVRGWCRREGAQHLAVEDIAPSIGTVGDAYDNALMESLIGLYKTECIGTAVFHDGPYKTLADVEFATAGWVEWYNNSRLHSSIGMVPPTEYEQNHHAALNLEPQSI